MQVLTLTSIVDEVIIKAWFAWALPDDGKVQAMLILAAECAPLLAEAVNAIVRARLNVK
jgi:hypothetical protein